MSGRKNVLLLIAAVSMGFGACSRTDSQAPSGASSGATQSHGLESATARFVVELESAPVGVAKARAAATGAPFDAAAYEAELAKGQDAVLAELASQGIATAVSSVSATTADGTSTATALRWMYAYNGFAVEAPVGARATIEALPGVRRVQEDTEVHALLAESVPYTGANLRWDIGFRGEGQIIADIDTGIDWAHPSFTNDPAALPGPAHPKVKHYMSYTAGAVTDDFGHGTHVGATIAGDRALGYTTGTVSEIDDLGRSLFDGMAPKADLWGYKVLSTAGSGLTTSIVMAINDSAARGADVLNLSLGSTADDPSSANSKAVDNAMLSGAVVAVAAGNSGPGYSTIGTPATARLALTVGATTDPGDNQYYAYDTTEVPARKMNLSLFSNSPPPPTPAVESEYVYVGEGCTPLDYGARAPVAGRIALIKRGTCTFSAKALLAQEQGAAAALIFNNVSGDYSGSMDKTRIMVGAISDVNGAHLVQFTGADGLSTHKVLLDPQAQTQAGQITGFSSRGPTDDYRIKPDVVAPGNTITAATSKIGLPAASMASASGYTTAGGTSMATPHVAGAAALLRQQHPAWTPFEVKVALMNSARRLTDPADGKLYSVMDQGAGLIDVPAASDIKGLLFVKRPDYGTGVIEGSYSFQRVDNKGGVVTRSVTFTLRDLSGTTRSYAISFEPGDGKNRGGEGRALPAAGFVAQLDQTSVEVPANGEATFTFTVSVDGAVLASGDYEGWIVARAADQTLHAPVFYRAESGSAGGLPAPEVTAPATASGSFSLSWGALDGAKGYRVQEATQAPVQQVSDDAESGFAQWTVGGTAGPLGWTSSFGRANSGSASFYATQASSQNNTLTLEAPVQIPAGASAALSYWTFYDIEPGFDFGYVEASRDGKSWTTLESLDGASGTWVRRELDLSRFAGGPVHVRFRYTTDLVVDVGAHEGWYVDDVSITTSNWTTLADTTDTSFTVSGRASGTYLYRVAALFDTADALSVPGPYSAPVSVVVALADLVMDSQDLTFVQSGHSATVTAVVQNAGQGAAENVVVRFFVDGEQIGTDQTVSQLTAGAQATVSVEWKLRGMNGTRTVTAVADPDGAIAEDREDNNTATQTVQIRGNRIKNGSFETRDGSGNPEGWSGSGSTANGDDPALATDGQRSALVVGTGSPLSGAWVSDPVAVSAGEVLTVSVDAVTVNASSGPQLAVQFVDSVGGVLGVLTVATGATSSLTLSGLVEVPAGAAALRIELRGFASTDLLTSGTVSFDNVGVY